MAMGMAGPAFSPETASRRDTYHEVWHLKLSTPDGQHALWLRFSQLVSSNGFKRVAESWAVYFRRGQQREVTRVALKQSQDISALTYTPGEGLKIGGSCLAADRTFG